MRRRGRRSVHLFCLLQRIIVVVVVVVVVVVGGGGGGTVAFCRGVRAAEDEEGRASSVSSFRAASRVTRNTNNNNNNNNNNNDELLRHWLFSLQLQIPDERFSAFDDTIAISLTDIECQNFTTKDVKSSTLSSKLNDIVDNNVDDDFDNNNKRSLYARVIDFGASCSGDWTVSSSTSNTKEVGGKVNAEVVEGDLQVYAEFVDRDDDDDGKNNVNNNSTNNNYKLPKTVRFPNCSMQMDVDRLHFTPMNDYDHDKTDNSANNTNNSNYKKSRSEEIARLLNKAAPEIAKAMQKSFAKVACEKIESVEKDSKTLAFFEHVDNYVEKNFLAGESPDSSSNGIDDRDDGNIGDNNNEIFNWNDSTLIRVLNFISSEYIGTSGPRSLNQFIKWFSNHTGALFVPREKLIDTETGEPYFVLSKTYVGGGGEDFALLQSISFAITEIEFVGLDTADILFGPVAGGHYVTKAAVGNNVSRSSLLGFSVGWNQTRIMMKGQLEIVPAAHQSTSSTNQVANWIENVTLSLEIDDMEIGMDVDLRVVEKKWKLLTQEQFKNLACLFGIVEKFDVERLLWDGKVARLTIVDNDTNTSSSSTSSSDNNGSNSDGRNSDGNNLEADLQSIISNLSELITSSYQKVVSLIAAGEFKSVLEPILNAFILDKFNEISSRECPKQNVKSLELIETANTFVSVFFFIVGVSCIVLAFLTYFVVPASFIRKLNHRAMKKMKAREMHDPFDDDHDDGIDDDDTLGLANESDEDTSNDVGEVDTTSAPRQIKRQTTKKKTHRRNRTGSAILTSLLTTNESSDSYSDDDAFADDDEREEGRKKRGSQREEYAMRFPETAWRTHSSRERKANDTRSTRRNKSSRYKKLFSMEDSLSKSIPVNSRWSLRLLFIANVLLFLSANTDSGASVSLFATLTTPVIDPSSFSSDLSSTPSFNGALLNAINGGRKTLLYANASSSTTTDNKNNKQQQQQQQQQQQKYNVIQASREDLFNFSLGGTVRDMWHAKVYAIAVCIVLFSGVWPYVKLFSMFILWEISGKTVKASTRGKWLKFVDRLGKWSLFDSFVMTMFMVGFRFHLHVTEDDDYDDIITQKISPSSFGDLDVVVTPKRSFYVFLFATVLSLVLGHVALFIHRKSVRSKTEVDDTAAPLWRRDVNRPSVLLRTKIAALQAAVVFLFLVASVVSLAVGVSIPSIKFDFLGIAGYALGSNEKTRSFSLVELAEALPHANIDTYARGSATISSPNETLRMFFQRIGPRFIQITLYIFAVVAPLAQLLILCALWIWPLTPRVQRRIQTIAEIFSAWSSLDVVLFAVVAAMLQIKQFANFIVGGGCLRFNTILAAIGTGQTSDSFSNAEGHRIDDECFDLDTYFEPGCWLLISSALMANFVGMWVTKRCDKSVSNNALRLQTSLLRGLREDDDEDASQLELEDDEELDELDELDELEEDRSVLLDADVEDDGDED